MSRFTTSALFLTLIFALAPTHSLMAQNEPSDADRTEERGRFRRGGRGLDMDRFYDRIADELALTEEQRVELDALRAEQRERMETFRQRRDAIRQAEREGDETTAQQLRDEMRAEREERGGRRGFMMETTSAIDAILTDAQREKFATLRETMRTEREQEMRQRFEERYTQMADELGLDEEQRQVLEDVKAGQIERMQQMRERWDAVRQAYDDGNDALADQLREQLVSEMREGGGPRGFRDEAFAELDPYLTDDQREIAAQMQDERRMRRDERRGREMNDDMPPQTAGESTTIANEPGEPAAGEARPMDDSPQAVAQAVGLSSEQSAAYAQLAAGYKQTSGKLNSDIDMLNEQIRVAQMRGDNAAVEQLTQSLAETEAKAAAAEEAFHSNVAAMLTPDQKTAYEEFRAEAQSEAILKDIPADLRTVLRAAMKLKLDRNQSRQIREIIKDSKTQLRKARDKDRAARDRERTAEKALADQFKARITSMLTPEQTQTYVETLDRMTPRRERERTRGI